MMLISVTNSSIEQSQEKTAMQRLIRTQLDKLIAIAILGLTLFGFTAPANAQSGGSGTIAIISIIGPRGGHALEATNVDVNAAGTEVTVTVRDPNCPGKTSKFKVNVRTQKITSHTGDKCGDWTGYRVRGILRMKKKPPVADAGVAPADVHSTTEVRTEQGS